MKIDRKYRLKIIHPDTDYVAYWSGKNGGYITPAKCIAAYNATPYQTIEQDKKRGFKFIVVEETHTIEEREMPEYKI